MPYMGTPSFQVCTRCTRMFSHGRKCPACGNPKTRPFRETTAAERARWEDKKHYADPARETTITIHIQEEFERTFGGKPGPIDPVTLALAAEGFSRANVKADAEDPDR